MKWQDYIGPAALLAAVGVGGWMLTRTVKPYEGLSCRPLGPIEWVPFWMSINEKIRSGLSAKAVLPPAMIAQKAWEETFSESTPQCIITPQGDRQAWADFVDAVAAEIEIHRAQQRGDA